MITRAHSVEVEQAVLGGLMLDSSTWDTVADRITADGFYRRDHQLIFAAIADLAAHGEPLDPITLAEHLDARDQLEASGGLEYLSKLCWETACESNAPLYAQRVADLARIRRLKSAALNLIESDDFDAALSEMRELIGVAA